MMSTSAATVLTGLLFICRCMLPNLLTPSAITATISTAEFIPASSTDATIWLLRDHQRSAQCVLRALATSHPRMITHQLSTTPTSDTHTAAIEGITIFGVKQEIQHIWCHQRLPTRTSRWCSGQIWRDMDLGSWFRSTWMEELFTVIRETMEHSKVLSWG